jgi:hypothetical protein
MALSLPVPTKTLLVALQHWTTLPSNQYLNPNFEEDGVFSLVFSQVMKQGKSSLEVFQGRSPLEVFN